MAVFIITEPIEIVTEYCGQIVPTPKHNLPIKSWTYVIILWCHLTVIHINIWKSAILCSNILLRHKQPWLSSFIICCVTSQSLTCCFIIRLWLIPDDQKESLKKSVTTTCHAIGVETYVHSLAYFLSKKREVCEHLLDLLKYFISKLGSFNCLEYL